MTPTDFYKDKQALSVSDVFLMLEKYVSQRKTKDPDYHVNEHIEKSLKYTQDFAAFKNMETASKLREYVEMS